MLASFALTSLEKERFGASVLFERFPFSPSADERGRRAQDDYQHDKRYQERQRTGPVSHRRSRCGGCIGRGLVPGGGGGGGVCLGGLTVSEDGLQSAPGLRRRAADWQLRRALSVMRLQLALPRVCERGPTVSSREELRRWPCCRREDVPTVAAAPRLTAGVLTVVEDGLPSLRALQARRPVC